MKFGSDAMQCSIELAALVDCTEQNPRALTRVSPSFRWIFSAGIAALLHAMASESESALLRYPFMGRWRNRMRAIKVGNGATRNGTSQTHTFRPRTRVWSIIHTNTQTTNPI